MKQAQSAKRMVQSLFKKAAQLAMRQGNQLS